MDIFGQIVIARFGILGLFGVGWFGVVFNCSSVSLEICFESEDNEIRLSLICRLPAFPIMPG